MISKRIMTSLLVFCIIATLAEETEGFLSFLSPIDYQKKLENDRIGLQNNVPLNLHQRSEGSTLQAVLPPENMKKLMKVCVPIEVGIKMNSQKFHKYGDLLGEFLSDSLSEGIDADQ